MVRIYDMVSHIWIIDCLVGGWWSETSYSTCWEYKDKDNKYQVSILIFQLQILVKVSYSFFLNTKQNKTILGWTTKMTRVGLEPKSLD